MASASLLTTREETYAEPRSRPTGGASLLPPTTGPHASGTRARGRQLATLAMTSRSAPPAFSPDGRRIVTASADKTARIWDAVTAKPLHVLSGHVDLVWSAAFSPDGRRIVTASFDQTARVWDADTAKQLAVLTGHGDDIWWAAWSPDGRRIVTASLDRTARIWDAAGVQLAVLSGHGDGVWSAAWSPDGRRIVTTSADQTARIWDATDTRTWTDRLRGRKQRKSMTCPTSSEPVWAWRRMRGSGPGLTMLPDAIRRLQRLMIQIVGCQASRKRTSLSVLQPTPARRKSQSPEAAPRLSYQLGRALLAKDDRKGALREFEFAVSHGYRAAQVDLADLLADAPDGLSDHDRAVSLYEEAWRDGVPIAAFKLGQLYERRAAGASGIATCCASAGPIEGLVLVPKGCGDRRTQRARKARRARRCCRRHRKLAAEEEDSLAQGLRFIRCRCRARPG